MVDKKLVQREYHAVKDYKLRGSRYIPSQDDSVSGGSAHDSKEDSTEPAVNSVPMSQRSTTKGSTQSSNHSLPQKTQNTKRPPTDSADNESRSSGAKLPKKKKSSCCISVGEKVIIKQKLKETDEPSDFTLVKGSIYIRKSAVDTAATKSEPEELPAPTPLPDIPEDGEPGSKGVQVTNIKECILCCEHLKCGLRELLHLCDTDPDAFIRRYENRNVHYEMRDENSDERLLFEMDKTHGDVFGDPKYHYLMVDKSTLLDEEIPKIEEVPGELHVATDISVTKVESKKSARLNVETPPQETTYDLSTFYTESSHHETVEDSKTPSDTIVTSEKLPPDVEVELQAAYEETPRSYDTSIFVSTFAELHQHDRNTEDSEQSVHEQHAEEIQLGDIQEHVDQPHRVSIIWDDAIDPVSKVVKSQSDERERRVSAVSWSGVDNTKLAQIGTAPVMEPAKKTNIKNSIFESIVREERMKNYGSKNRQRGKSLIEGSDSAAQKKKWFGLKKTKRAQSTVEPYRQSSIGRRSIIGSVVTDEEDVDSTYLIKETSDEEKSGSISSHRNSLEAYRRRSVSVEHPVFEKHREINEYLHNV